VGGEVKYVIHENVKLSLLHEFIRCKVSTDPAILDLGNGLSCVVNLHHFHFTSG